MAEVWAWLEATSAAVVLRDSVWLYPLVNAGHILGVALLVGAIVPLDLRLLGVWPQLPMAPIRQAASAVARLGLLLAAVCGVLLFTTRASEYVVSPYFQFKLALITLALANALWLNRVLDAATVTGDVARGTAGAVSSPETIPSITVSSGTSSRLEGEPWRSRRVRWGAGVSLSAWVLALVMGRLVGYF